MNQTLLVELLTEELPPKALAKLGDAFAAGIFNGLKTRDLLDPQSGVSSYATPRRLAVTINGVRPVSPDKSMREKVLPVSVALDANGQPTAPLAKKLAALAAQTGSAPIMLDQLERAPDGKADSFFYSYTAQGVSLQAGLQAALDDTAGRLPIPKVMSYQRHSGRDAGETVNFVRPAHRLIALHGKDILPVHLLGLDAGYTTLGHRFLSDGEIPVYEPEMYANILKIQGKVIAGFADRKEAIRTALLEKAGEDSVLMPESLLDEVTSLVEWPVVYECRFEDVFLTVPQECLILTMQTNQKYFALTDAAGKLRSRFLIVSNLETDDPRHIIQGNERVVRPRLSDAKFFFEQDKKRSLASRVPQLANVVYHNKLGNQLQRTERVTALARAIAAMMDTDVALAERAATLAKTDLLTDMVGEFPELQGVMGAYYARHDGEPADVAKAASEHYQPRFAGDALPTTSTGTVVALADKLETLVGIWGIGLQPTGDKDPFALRRHALGVLRMLIEKQLPLDLVALLQAAQDAFQPGLLDASPRKKADGSGSGTVDTGIVATDKNVSVFDFMIDRLAGYLRDKEYTSQAIQAVLGLAPTRLDTVVDKLEAVRTFASLPEAEALAAANKRITNILKKTDAATGTVDTALLHETAEQKLQAAMTLLQPQVDQAFEQGDFTGALKALAQLRDDVDGFFNDVMVMVEDAQLRRNRLALLSALHAMMNRVADISKLAA